MGHIYEWIEEEMWNRALDMEPRLESVLDVIVFPWSDDWDWDPAHYAKKNLIAILKDEAGNKIGELHFRIIVNPDYGEMEEPLWIIDEASVKLKLCSLSGVSGT